MCIIAAKKKGVPMPSDQTIENMFENNSDGAGFMYAKDGKVFIEKGFMTLDEFRKALRRAGKKTDLTNTAVVMHFRITTHGGTKPANCHPFPISDSYGKLGKLSQSAKIGVAHNGIIHSVDPKKGASDTMTYIAEQLAPLARFAPEFYRDPNAMQMVQNAIQSKLCILNAKGEIFTIGKFTEDNGMLYSNDSYSYRWMRHSALYGDWFGYSYHGSSSKGTKSAAKSSTPTAAESTKPEAKSKDNAPFDIEDDVALEYLDVFNPHNPITYREVPLMLLNYGGAGEEVVVNEFETLLDTEVDDYYIDAEGKVYRFSYILDACVYCPGYIAYDDQLRALCFDENRAYSETVAYNVSL